LLCRLSAAEPCRRTHKEFAMLSWSLTFFLFAIIAGVFGFAGIAGTAAWIAQVLFVLFLVLFLVSFLTGRRAPV
jgi:uncharacterized membrane protein YtjA (UPF0391 family)